MIKGGCLNKTRHFLNLYRRYPHWNSAGCIYIHIPKAAGTSINKAIYGRTLGHYRADEIASRFPELYKDCFTFSFVRNPWSRVLSAYRFARIGKTESMGISYPEKYKIPEFETFERFVLDWLPYKNLEKEDFVFQHQCKYVFNKNNKRMVDFIGKVECLDVDIKVVEDALSKAIDLKHDNRTSLTTGYHAAYVNSEMVDVVASIYADDVDLFDYQFEGE